MANSNGNMRLLITIVIVIAGVATSWGVMQATQDSLKATVDTLCIEVDKKVEKQEFEKLQKQVTETHDSVIRLETQMKISMKTLDKILEKLDK